MEFSKLPPEVVAEKKIKPEFLKGLRALLINMPIRESVAPNCAPLAVALLAGRLRSFGAEVSILDLNAYRTFRPDESLRWLDKRAAGDILNQHIAANGKPDFVGLSGMITTLAWQEWAAKAVNELVPEAYLASGGGLATCFGESLWEWIPELDGICVGQGDSVIVDMVNRREGLKRIWRGNNHDLDALAPPAWDLLQKDIYGTAILEGYLKRPLWGEGTGNLNGWGPPSRRSLNTVSSRGCPFACRFCFHESTGGRTYSMRSAESMAEEVKRLHADYDIDFLGILDDNFLVDADRIMRMTGKFRTACMAGLISWGTHARLDDATPERLSAAEMAGCVYIGYGAETASPSMVAAMNKGGGILKNGTTRIGGYDVPTMMVQGYENTLKAKIHGNCTWIMGFPGETLHDLKHSVAFMDWQQGIAKADRPVNLRMFTATAYPGTAMFSHPKVRARLELGFRIKYDSTGKPIVNEDLRQYVLRLDDAEKVLTDLDGDPVYYGEMPEKTFLYARELIAAGKTTEILSL